MTVLARGLCCTNPSSASGRAPCSQWYRFETPAMSFRCSSFCATTTASYGLYLARRALAEYHMTTGALVFRGVNLGALAGGLIGPRFHPRRPLIYGIGDVCRGSRGLCDDPLADPRSVVLRSLTARVGMKGGECLWQAVPTGWRRRES